MSAVVTFLPSRFEKARIAFSLTPSVTTVTLLFNLSASSTLTAAFVFASMFNVPCVLAMGSTYREANSLKWLLAIMGYYFAISLGLAFVAYHIGLLIF